MCTKFHLTRRDLIAYTEPLEIELTLTEVLAVPGHYSQENFVPAPLVRWAVLPHDPGDSRMATLYAAGNPGPPVYKYTLVAL